jgi:hypothetical protein
MTANPGAIAHPARAIANPPARRAEAAAGPIGVGHGKSHADVVAHIVLYRPKPGLDAEARLRFTNALVAARREIPSVRRFHVGQRITDGPSYAMGPLPEFPYVAVIEFEDRAGLLEYLAHPAHASLGQAFGAAVDAALVYDFDMADASAAASFISA